MFNLSKLSIIIPTYNRPFFALRNMEFWSGTSVSVFILDGSSNAISFNLINKYEENIHYFHISKSFEERLHFGINQVKTDYVMLCGDDEFMIKSGLNSCIEFLENNKDYTSCTGRCVGFNPLNNIIHLFPVKERHRFHSVNQNSVAARINYHIENFNVTTIYGVHRIESFKFCTEFLENIKFTSPYVFETLFELFSAAYGKSKVLSNLTWMRSFENSPIDNEMHSRKYSISDWFDDKRMVDEIRFFQLLVKDRLSLLCSGEILNDTQMIAFAALKVRIDNDRIDENRVSKKNKFLFYSFLKKILHKIFFKLRLLDLPSFFVNKKRFSYLHLKKSSQIDLNDFELTYLMEFIRSYKV